MEGVVTEDDWLEERGDSPAGLNLPAAASSSDFSILLAEAPGTALAFNASGLVRVIASSDRVSTDCADAMVGERALSGASLSATVDSGESRQEDSLSISGGHVVRVDISSAIDVAFRLGVLSLGVGIEANQKRNDIGSGWYRGLTRRDKKNRPAMCKHNARKILRRDKREGLK